MARRRRSGGRRRSYRRSRRGVGGHHRTRGFFGGALRTFKRNVPPAVALIGLSAPAFMSGQTGGQSPVDAATTKGVTISERFTNTSYNLLDSYKTNWVYPVAGVVGAVVLRKAMKFVRG